MNGITLVFILKREAPKRKLVKKERQRERELITKEVSLIKKKCNVKCSFTKQAMTYLAWSIHTKQELSDPTAEIERNRETTKVVSTISAQQYI